MRTIVKSFEVALIIVGVAIGLAIYMTFMGLIIGVALLVQNLREMRTSYATLLADDRA